MSPRTLLILIVLTALAGLAAWGLSTRASDASHSAGGPLLEGLTERINDVAALTVTTPVERFTVRRSEQGWTMDEKDGYPVAYETVKQTLLGLAEMTRLEPKTDNPALYGRIGVQDPAEPEADSILFTLLDDAGSALAAVVVGDGGPGRGTRYVRRAGDDASWLVTLDLVPERRASFWLDRRILELETARVRSVMITHPDGQQVAVTKEDREDAAWEVRDVPADREPLNATIGRTVAGALDGLDLDDVRALDDAWPQGDETVQTTFDTFDGLQLVLTTTVQGGGGEDDATDEVVWLHAEVSAGEEASDAVRQEAEELGARLAPWVFSLPRYRAVNLRKRMDELTRERPPVETVEEATEEPGPTSPADGGSADDEAQAEQPVDEPGDAPTEEPDEPGGDSAG